MTNYNIIRKGGRKALPLISTTSQQPLWYPEKQKVLASHGTFLYTHTLIIRPYINRRKPYAQYNKETNRKTKIPTIPNSSLPTNLAGH